MISLLSAATILCLAQLDLAVDVADGSTSISVPVAAQDEGGLHVIPKHGTDELVNAFVKHNEEPRHAVAILVAGKGTKREKLIEELSNDPVLKLLMVFGVRYAKGDSSLTVHRHSYEPVVYSGKWTKKELTAWLSDVAYPPVNRITRSFSAQKYLVVNPFGVLVVGYPAKDPSPEILRELEIQADRFKTQFKITFFTRNPQTVHICDGMGLTGNDELLLLTDPKAQPGVGQTSYPGAPKYRRAGVTPDSIREFFEGFSAGTLKPYYRPAGPYNGPVVGSEGIRELSAWDFNEVTQDPTKSVFVVFVSDDCGPCREYATAYSQIARKLADKQRSKDGASGFAHFVLCRIDQTNQEHGENVQGVPHIKYYPRGNTNGKKKESITFSQVGFEKTWAFLEARADVESNNEL